MSPITPPFSAAEAPSPNARSDRATSSPYPRLDGIDVLLVDDDAAVLDAFRFAFEAAGATVRTASSARDAWEAFRRCVPGVLVSDIAMPGEDGCALLRRIRAVPEGATVPAVALTGYVGPEDEVRIRAAGFAAFAAKPADPVALAQLVLRVLR